MRFSNAQLQGALLSWRALTNIEKRSEADNLWFEQRVSAARQAAFEVEATGANDAVALRKAHTDYHKEFVVVDVGDIPHTFDSAVAPADLGTIDEMQKIIRIESLVRPLDKLGMTFDQLRKAVDDNQTALIDNFLQTWNTSNVRDGRPAFAAFKDEVTDDLARPDWPDRLRDRLGLAHYDCKAGPIPIALMEYSVAEVRAATASVTGIAAFTAPTVLDTSPWPYFFPAPAGLPCGRTMALYKVASDNDLLAEILHFRMAYTRNHIARVDEIRTPPAAFDLRAIRNHHLFALHVAAGRDDFGEEISV